MIDVMTKQPLRVIPDERAGPYIELAESQVEDLQRLLDRHGVRYWVSENSFSWNDGPFETVISFGQNGNADLIQAILDSVV